MNKWQKRNRPMRLEKRFEFASYQATRDFLDYLGQLSETSNRFPDISFGKTYVNITLRPEREEQDALITESDRKFAAEIDGLLD